MDKENSEKVDSGIAESGAATTSEIVANLSNLYCNSAKVTHMLYDFQIILGLQLIDNLSDRTHSVIVAKQLIHMSPQHFKAFTLACNSQLEKYEGAFGVISIPQP